MTSSEFEEACVVSSNGSCFSSKRKGAVGRVETVARVEAFMPLEDVLLVSEEHAPFLIVSPSKKDKARFDMSIMKRT
jgi:hypothetical protein